MLKELIYEKWKESFKNRDNITKTAFESIKTRIVNLEKSQKEYSATDEDVEKLIGKEIKELEEERNFHAEGTSDYNTLTKKINILTPFLPKQMSDEEVIAIIQDLAKNEPNKGKLIGQVIKAVGNKYDRSKIAKLVNSVVE